MKFSQYKDFYHLKMKNLYFLWKYAPMLRPQPLQFLNSGQLLQPRGLEKNPCLKSLKTAMAATVGVNFQKINIFLILNGEKIHYGVEPSFKFKVLHFT